MRSFSGAQSGGSRGWKNETPQGSKTEVRETYIKGTLVVISRDRFTHDGTI